MKKIQLFVESVLKKQNKFKKLRIKKLSDVEVDLIKLKTGFNLEGFTRTIDESGVIHAFKEHGNKITEKQRGNIAISASDFENIFKVWNTKNIVFSGKDKLGNDLILYQKNIGTRHYYVEEIRVGKKEVALKSFYKKRAV